MKAIIRLLLDIKFSHTVFAMPFAILGAFMAATFEGPVDWSLLGGQLTVIVLCMVFARTVAMLANRILDRKIDADNPRTSSRGERTACECEGADCGLATRKSGIVWSVAGSERT